MDDLKQTLRANGIALIRKMCSHEVITSEDFKMTELKEFERTNGASTPEYPNYLHNAWGYRYCPENKTWVFVETAEIQGGV